MDTESSKSIKLMAAAWVQLCSSVLTRSIASILDESTRGADASVEALKLWHEAIYLS